jgi:hypothetical protein
MENQTNQKWDKTNRHMKTGRKEKRQIESGEIKIDQRQERQDKDKARPTLQTLPSCHWWP